MGSTTTTATIPVIEKAVSVRIGVLALQGDFIEHIIALNKIPNVFAKEIKNVDDLEDLDGIIIPGGESTAISLLGEYNGLIGSLKTWVREDKPVWGTCAGAIMLSNNVFAQKLGGQGLIGGMDVITHRNFFGRQLSSFEMPLSFDIPSFEGKPFPGVFIRAPAILGVADKKGSEEVQVLSSIQVPQSVLGDPAVLSHTKDNTVIVAAKQRNLLASIFHPEITTDTRFHEYFVDLVRKHKVSVNT
eukprot:TRINITY_DN5348_c0_g1_i1.p1 TRINITY_DN5348_c0_g1~~TRINITY_DN5348_c0_g1_i1.p1  ORF type:complete len:244 (-),score=43.58 TRINITY_DN5348_c0_g1_i1:95-826(-)